MSARTRRGRGTSVDVRRGEKRTPKKWRDGKRKREREEKKKKKKRRSVEKIQGGTVSRRALRFGSETRDADRAIR